MLNLFEIIFFKNIINKITLKGQKKKYLSLIFKNWKIFKFKKLKTNFFLILIILKLKPCFNVKKQIGPINSSGKRSYFKPKYFPLFVHSNKGINIAVTWFLIPLAFKKTKKSKFTVDLQTCFYLFLNDKRTNFGLICKKNIYLKTLKNKKLFRYS